MTISSAPNENLPVDHRKASMAVEASAKLPLHRSQTIIDRRSSPMNGLRVKPYHNKGMLLGALAITILANAVQPLSAEVQKKTFNLRLNPKFGACAGAQGGPSPSATVTVVRGSLADTLTITGKNFQPNIGFDLFTIQRSDLLSNGQLDPNFTNFGQAWYQTDIQSDAYGNLSAQITTILLDQIFGFDPDVNLAPTQALHVGIWFDDPNTAEPCGFNPKTPTPFNGQHQAGPNALISVPNATTNLGPLCTAAIKQGSTYVCNINQ